MTHWRLQKEESTHMNQSCSSVRTKSSLWILLYCWAWTHIHNTQKAQALYRKTLNTFSIFKRKQPGGGCEPTRGRVALSREARVVRPPDTLDLLNNSPRAPLDTGEEHWDRANQILSESFFDSFSRPTIHSLPTGYSPGQTIMHRCSVFTQLFLLLFVKTKNEQYIWRAILLQSGDFHVLTSHICACGRKLCQSSCNKQRETEREILLTLGQLTI